MYVYIYPCRVCGSIRSVRNRDIIVWYGQRYSIKIDVLLLAGKPHRVLRTCSKRKKPITLPHFRFTYFFIWCDHKFDHFLVAFEKSNEPAFIINNFISFSLLYLRIVRSIWIRTVRFCVVEQNKCYLMRLNNIFMSLILFKCYMLLMNIMDTHHMVILFNPIYVGICVNITKKV